MAQIMVTPTLLIHGGAGTIRRPEADARAALTPYERALMRVLERGEQALSRGASALDVVCQAVSDLEDEPLFNAGYGAVLHARGGHELDAAVACGSTRRAAALAGLVHTAHPVQAARALLEADQAPVMLIGSEGDAFASRVGLPQVPNASFTTPARRSQWEAWRATQSGVAWMDHDGTARAPLEERSKMGTVGAVALDAQGRLAAATSTGGMTGKWPGRVGDAPVIGSGTWADERVAVSCTGQGEAFIRAAAAHAVAARMRWAGLSIEVAAHQTIHEDVAAFDAQGGLIAIGRDGRWAMPFNSEGMYRGVVQVGLQPEVSVFKP
jgi:beta-aspartyl-peptidase (threonine type)